MKTVAIVSEYNPFHKGHKYQLEQIKKDFGEDVCIVAVMSGNYVQRGDLAILDKFSRARMAIEEGVSLVLENPFPYSMQSAELFASSAVRIICSTVKPNAISFGCECNDVSLLRKTAENSMSDEFLKLLTKNISDESTKNLGFPQIYELTYKALYKDKSCARILEEPNNVLALEYIKAIIRENADIELHAVKRAGAMHDEEFSPENDISSASAIRNLFLKNEPETAFSLLPDASRKICMEAYENGILPTNISRLSNAMLAFLRINSPEDTKEAFDSDGGLAHRLRKFSMQAKNINELITLVSTKRYTTARIRRALLNLFFGITSSDVKNLPAYTQVLAMDQKGRKKLKEIKGKTELEILTKPADYVFLSDPARKQAEISNTADAVYSLAKPLPMSGDEFLRATPFCKK